MDIAIETSEMSMRAADSASSTSRGGSGLPILPVRGKPCLTGTFLRNELPDDCERALLHDGDVVSIGSATFIVHIPGEEDDEYFE